MNKIYVIDVLREFIKDFNEFLGHHKKDSCEEGFYVMISDDYYYVDMKSSYWYLEDDGTVVFRVNDE